MAFSRALKIEKLKAPHFRGPKGPGLQMTGALKKSKLSVTGERMELNTGKPPV